MNKILRLNVTHKCNKLCSYCYYKLTDQHFDFSKLYKLDDIDFSTISCIWLIGGEPGILCSNEIEAILNKLPTNSNINLYTNGLYLQKYSLLPRFNWNIYLHITDFLMYNITNVNKYWQYINFVYVLNSTADFNNLKYILYKTTKIEIAFNENIHSNDISFELYNNWIHLINTCDISLFNNSNRIHPDIFKLLINKNISYSSFKLLLLNNIKMLEKYWNLLTNEYITINLF